MHQLKKIGPMVLLHRHSPSVPLVIAIPLSSTICSRQPLPRSFTASQGRSSSYHRCPTLRRRPRGRAGHSSQTLNPLRQGSASPRVVSSGGGKGASCPPQGKPESYRSNKQAHGQARGLHPPIVSGGSMVSPLSHQFLACMFIGESSSSSADDELRLRLDEVDGARLMAVVVDGGLKVVVVVGGGEEEEGEKDKII